MEEKILPKYETCWGEKKAVVLNVKAEVCPKCGEVVFDMDEALRVQNETIGQVTSE
jgi:YgiT-type zinc finger domain-containing protein